ncbi:hypothetical protein H0H81_009441 [Sphagnurus paluster]|uniref:Metallo-beta-lactamase domain-containing protein n=1 Tax=Sphagnurus paluster TaxID=117069 RepID=A0A9P7FS43_9AGAR|nr:hypothetical protein H0H81_009441 [Sphagnurus paluster]
MPPTTLVDGLTITFLVDNCIEWFDFFGMSKLPPGFVHELPQHIQLYPELDELTGVPVETVVNGEGSHTTLFDTGPDNKSLIRNLLAMKIRVDNIERVIISHWHRDHTGGLLSFLDFRDPNQQLKPCVIDVHPDQPLARGIAPGPNFDKVICALRRDPTFEEIETAGGIVEKSVEGHAVAGNTVWVSGEIPRTTSFEQGMMGGMRWYRESGEAGEWLKEQVCWINKRANDCNA